MLILLEQFNPFFTTTGRVQFERLTSEQAAQMLQSDPAAVSASGAASIELGVQLLNHLGDEIRLSPGDRAVCKFGGRWALATVQP